MFTRASLTKPSAGLKKVKAIAGNSPAGQRDPEYREKWLGKMDFLSSVSAQTNAALLLHDISANRFIFMSDNAKILGNYKPEDFTSETGIDFSFSNIHPQQRTAALMFQLKTISYGFEHPYKCLNKIVGSITCLYKRGGGRFFQLLQKVMVVETDADGNPLLLLRFLSDISHLVKPSAVLIINGPDETLIWTYNNNNKCLDQVNLLSAQEKKILGLLAQGRQSKEIADMLFISSHTIDTHRRHLLKKTNCIDTTALITFAKMTGLI